jgi:formylglycine-generating enzyme
MTGKNIKCTNCGASLDIPEGFNSVYCAYCNSQNFITEVLELPGVTLLCLICNTKNKDETLFCGKCGSKLQTKCRYCGENHSVNKKFCPKTGLAIEHEVLRNYLINIKMLFITGGKFQMGSTKKDQESPVHSVTLNNFFMSNYTVTNEDYCEFLNAAGNQPEGKALWLKIEKNEYSGIVKDEKFTVKSGYEKRPVVYITWYGAAAYCNWLSEKEGLDKCYGDINHRGNVDINKKGYRLPTEAEWEYACRAGTTTDYYWGDTMNDNFCWYSGNSGNNHHEGGTAGESGHPNNFGLYDMSGNIWQWCSDWYWSYPSTDLINPAGPSSGSRRVVRGGSWKQDENLCRSSNRSDWPPGMGSNILGFRIVRSQ